MTISMPWQHINAHTPAIDKEFSKKQKELYEPTYKQNGTIFVKVSK